jgi:hypothetical protein
MSTSGTLLPAAIPVRSFSKPLYGIWPDFSSSSSAINIVGTPWRAVHPSSRTDLSVATGSKHSAGKTIEAAMCSVSIRFGEEPMETNHE